MVVRVGKMDRAPHGDEGLPHTKKYTSTLRSLAIDQKKKKRSNHHPFNKVRVDNGWPEKKTKLNE